MKLLKEFSEDSSESGLQSAGGDGGDFQMMDTDNSLRSSHSSPRPTLLESVYVEMFDDFAQGEDRALKRLRAAAPPPQQGGQGPARGAASPSGGHRMAPHAQDPELRSLHGVGHAILGCAFRVMMKGEHPRSGQSDPISFKHYRKIMKEVLAKVRRCKRARPQGLKATRFPTTGSTYK